MRTKLKLDALTVESFVTDGRLVDADGTVHGHQPGGGTFYGTCQGTCVNTCGGPTCEFPCQTADTCHLTCRSACAWTNGYQVCKEP